MQKFAFRFQSSSSPHSIRHHLMKRCRLSVQPCFILFHWDDSALVLTHFCATCDNVIHRISILARVNARLASVHPALRSFFVLVSLSSLEMLMSRTSPLATQLAMLADRGLTSTLLAYMDQFWSLAWFLGRVSLTCIMARFEIGRRAIQS